MITILCTLVMVALLSGSWRPGLLRNQQILWVSLTAGALLVTTLMTARSVLFLPLFLLLCVSDEGTSGNTTKPRWNFPAFSIFLTAFGLGVLVSWLRAPSTTVALFADILQPLLGPRWMSNVLWLAVVSTLLTVFRPWKALPLLHDAGLNSPAGVALLAWANTLVFAATFRLILPSMEIFAQYLLFSCGPMLAFAAMLFAVSSSRRKSFLWMLLAVISAMGSWGMIAAGGKTPAADAQKNLIAVLELVTEDDLLLMPADIPQSNQYRIPFDLAGRGNIQTHANAAALKSRLEEATWLNDHTTIWMLRRNESQQPWEEVHSASSKKSTRTGQPTARLVLHKFIPNQFPHSITVYADGGKTGSRSSVQGINNDGVWTTGQLKLGFDFSGITADHLEITLKGWRPGNAAPLAIGLDARLNNVQLEVQMAEKTMLIFRIPSGLLLPAGNMLTIKSSTFIPHDLDPGSSDKRSLGLDLHKIILR